MAYVSRNNRKIVGDCNRSPQKVRPGSYGSSGCEKSRFEPRSGECNKNDIKDVFGRNASNLSIETTAAAVLPRRKITCGFPA
jgi:hypothetical protein